MKVRVNNTPPALAPGQLWQHNSSGTIYLVYRPQYPSAARQPLLLLNTTTYQSVFSNAGGFNNLQHEFTYMGNLEISE